MLKIRQFQRNVETVLDGEQEHAVVPVLLVFILIGQNEPLVEAHKVLKIIQGIPHPLLYILGRRSLPGFSF